MLATMWSALRRIAVEVETQLMGGAGRRIDAWRGAIDPPGRWCLWCGRTLGSGTTAVVSPCDACRADGPDPARPWPLVRLGEYRGGLRDAVLGLKAGHDDALLDAVARCMAAQWRRVEHAAWRSLLEPAPADRSIAVQPIPMPWLRRWERGHDHGRALARAVARSLGAPRIGVLQQRWGAPQARKGGAARRDASGPPRFAARRRAARSTGGTGAVLLVDDVCTTGSTLTEAASVLRRLGWGRVFAVVIAVAHDDPAGSGR